MNQPDDDQLLDRFRQWLAETRAAAEQVVGDEESAWASAEDDSSGSPGVGLYRLAEEFTALRQEVKLQTRSSRGLDEEIEKLLAALRQAIAALDSVKPLEQQAARSAGKGLALALADLDEALDRGRQQLERSGERLVELPDDALLADLDQAYAGLSWLQRWLSGGYHRRLRELVEQSDAAVQRRALLGALIDGYALIQQRLARALAAEGILRIAAVGQVVDPEQMIVLEMVETAGPPGLVVDEVRRGYTWNGRMLRYAEVRASRVLDEGNDE